jgi:large subunit ribosomal protein L29
MKTKEFKKKIEEMTEQELNVHENNLKDELFHLKFQWSTGHLDDVTKVRQAKKNRARLETILAEKRSGVFWEKRGLKQPEKGSSNPKASRSPRGKGEKKG